MIFVHPGSKFLRLLSLAAFFCLPGFDLRAQLFVPLDTGTTVNGFQDDFDGPGLNPNWTVAGDNIYSVTNGLLHVAAAGGDPNHLLYELPGYNNSVQEVLARMRVTGFGATSYSRGGVGVAVNGGSSQGINLTFRDTAAEGQSGPHLAFLDDFVVWGPGQPFVWQTNVWYWLRLRHEPNAASQGGVNDVFSKIWLADGTAPEPANWQATWDYTPAQGADTGYAGIMAGSTSGSDGYSEFDVDYFLVKASGLPGIVVAPRAVVQVPASITSGPDDLIAPELASAAFSVTATGNPAPGFQWFKANAPIPGATNATYSMAGVEWADNGALFSVAVSNVVSNLTYRATSRSAKLTVIADTTPPALLGAQSQGLTTVEASFSERVSPSDATNRANYVLTGPAGNVAILSAALDGSQSNVLLSVSALTALANYTLTVNGLRDQSAAGNLIANNSQASFTAVSYQSYDIGNPSPPSSVAATTNGYAITAGGSDIGGTADQFHFSFLPVTGNFDFAVRIASVGFSDPWVKAGLMARETTNAGSRFASVLATPANVGTFFLARGATGGQATPTGFFPVNYPCTWVRLQRAGNVFTGYAGVDGMHWSQVGTATLALPNSLFFGLAVSGHNASVATTAQFSSLPATSVVQAGGASLPFEPPGACSRRTGLVISEIMYHPAPRADGRHLEFVELYNSQAFSEDLTGYRLSGDITYKFPSGTTLPAGAFLVVAKAPADLQSVYGISGVLGPFTNNLSNSAGIVQLLNEQTSVLLEVDYDTHAPWPCAADGAGHSLVLARPSYGEGDARAWDVSDITGGSPGTAETYRPSSLRGVVINEFLAHTDDPAVDYVELYNHSAIPVDVSGCVLTDDAGTNKFVIPANTILTAGGFISFDQNQMQFALSAGGETIYFKNPDNSRVLDAVRFEAQANGVSSGRWPDGGPEFYPLTVPTPGAANRGIRIDDIVINELMYHPISGDDDDQYIELFNQGAQPVNLGGWSFVAGVGFTFPAGTILPSHTYLVVAKNQTNLLAKYPNLNAGNIIGNYAQSLSHHGERVALARPDFNVSTNAGGIRVTNAVFVVVDEVTYHKGGRWGEWAAGGGSSLELIDPRANHRLPSNWADSDETAKAPWTTIQNTGVLDFGMPGWDASAIHALMFDNGECLLDNVEVYNGNNNNNLIVNGTFESGTNGWVFEGDHETSSLETSGGDGSAKSLHLRAHGGGDSYGNRVYGSLSATVPAGATATLRARVRWLRGHPEVLLRFRGGALEATGSLNLPSNLGSPGAPNSRALMNAGPAIFGVTHTPALPAALQPVVVTAFVQDPDGVGSVQLRYRADPGTNYSMVAMRDDGTGGDTVAGDGIYSATIPGQTAGILVAFYIQSADNFSTAASTSFPADPSLHECLVRFGEPQPFGSFATYRLWLTQKSVNRWASRNRLNNEPLDVTLVSGNQRAIYNNEVHYGGSVWKANFNILDSPIGNMCDYDLKPPPDDPLLGASSLKWVFPGNVSSGNSGIDQTAQMEPTSYWLSRSLGIRSLQIRHINVFIDGVQRGSILYDMQVPNGDMISGLYPNDADGDLLKANFWFESDHVDTVGSSYGDSFATMAEFRTTGGAKKTARYRWNFNHEQGGSSYNDYTNWFTLIDALNAPSNYTAGVQALADTDEWMRFFAYEHLINNFECFGYSHGVNVFPYKGQRGLWTLLPYDVDISFLGSVPDFFTCDDPVLQRMMGNPPLRRAYWRAMQDAANGPLQSAAINALMDPRYAALQANGISVTPPDAIKSYIAAARAQILSQLNTVAANFMVAGPASFTTNHSPVTLSGTAPIAVANLTINGVVVPATWSSVSNWSVVVPLTTGTDVISLVGLDDHNNPVAGAAATVTVNFTGTSTNAPPTVVINEWMAGNTRTIVNPLSGKYDDWFELYNYGNSTVNLAGWHLTDDAANPTLFQIPPGYTIPPKGYLLVWADKPKTPPPVSTNLHVDFKLSKTGESIGLYGTNAALVDSVNFGVQADNISQGRFPDGGPNVYSFDLPTPANTNLYIPPPPQFSGLGQSGNNFILSVTATPGFKYQIEFKDQLGTAAGWSDLGPEILVTNTAPVMLPLAATNSQRFYRVVLLPP